MSKTRDLHKSWHSLPPKSPPWVRAAGALWMLAFLVWLPFEDTETWMALALGAGGCLWLGTRWLALRSEIVGLVRNLTAGALLGTATPLLAIALMALKSGLHAHGFADFTGRQLWEVISLMPFGIVVGSAAGLAAGLFIGKPIY